MNKSSQLHAAITVWCSDTWPCHGEVVRKKVGYASALQKIILELDIRDYGITY